MQAGGEADGPREIASEALTLADLPGPDATWEEVGAFALTWNGYAQAGSFEACARIAEARNATTLDDLRTALFFEQRRWRHFGETPEGDDLAYLRGLVEGIRRWVAGRSG